MKHIALCLAAMLPCFIFACNSGKNKDHRHTDDVDDTLLVHPDSILFSFVFMGCNRIDWKDTANKNTNASTANVPELQRTFNEVAHLHPKPDLFFFLGDLVLGLDQDPAKLRSQLEAWKKQYHDPAFSSLAKSGIKMIAVPGNHEMLYMDAQQNEVPWPGALPAWMSVMSDFMPDGHINRPGGSDHLLNLQTYSFNYRNTHFILMNTDTYNPKLKIGMAPASWINSDMASAKKDPSVEHIFLLGHKPAFVDQPITDLAERMDTNVRNTLWTGMENNEAEAMLSAHSHQYYRTQPHAAKSYQVIAGNGGSKYEKHLGKADEFFGYSIVYVLKNGQVVLRSMGRSVTNKKYLETLPKDLPTTLRDQVNITWGTAAPAWVPAK